MGVLSKSEQICGKRPFSSVFWMFQVLFAPSGKGRKKGRKRAKKADFGRFPGREARHPLNPHLLHPHLRHSKKRERGIERESPFPEHLLRLLLRLLNALNLLVSPNLQKGA